MLLLADAEKTGLMVLGFIVFGVFIAYRRKVYIEDHFPKGKGHPVTIIQEKMISVRELKKMIRKEAHENAAYMRILTCKPSEDKRTYTYVTEYFTYASTARSWD